MAKVPGLGTSACSAGSARKSSQQKLVEEGVCPARGWGKISERVPSAGGRARWLGAGMGSQVGPWVSSASGQRYEVLERVWSQAGQQSTRCTSKVWPGRGKAARRGGFKTASFPGSGSGLGAAMQSQVDPCVSSAFEQRFKVV